MRSSDVATRVLSVAQTLNQLYPHPGELSSQAEKSSDKTITEILVLS